MRITYCEIIKELLYSYNDGTISDEDKTKVEEHLKECALCKQEFNGLSSDNKYDDEMIKKNEAEEQEKENKRKKKKKRIIIASSISLFLIIVLIFSLTFEFQVKYEDIDDKIIFEEKDGELIVKIKNFNYSKGYEGTGYNDRDNENKIINGSYYIGFKTTLWNKYINIKDEKVIARLKDDIYKYDEKGNELNYNLKITKVYFQMYKETENRGSKSVGEPVLLWEKKN